MPTEDNPIWSYQEQSVQRADSLTPEGIHVPSVHLMMLSRPSEFYFRYATWSCYSPRIPSQFKMCADILVDKLFDQLSLFQKIRQTPVSHLHRLGATMNQRMCKISLLYRPKSFFFSNHQVTIFHISIIRLQVSPI